MSDMSDRDLAMTLVANAERFVDDATVPEGIREILRQVVEQRRRPPADLRGDQLVEIAMSEDADFATMAGRALLDHMDVDRVHIEGADGRWRTFCREDSP